MNFVEARKQDLEVLEATARRQEIKIKKEMRFIERFRYKATKAAAGAEPHKVLAKVERSLSPRDTRKSISISLNRRGAAKR